MTIEKLAFKDYYELINVPKIDLLLIIDFLQKDRKQWINQFSKTHNESVAIINKKQELINWLESKNKIILQQHKIVEPVIKVQEVIDKIKESE